MEVILLEHIEKLGKMGDKVSVKNGYARNYLLPQKKALRATEANLAVYEKQKAELEAHNQQLRADADKLAESLKGFSAILIRQAAETGQLYGSVTIRDIAAAIKEAGFSIERRQVYLEKTIKDLGVYQVKLNLHPEVSQTILINVARTDDEAKKQAMESIDLVKYKLEKKYNKINDSIKANNLRKAKEREYSSDELQ